MPDRYTISVEIDARDRTGPALGTVKRGFGEAFNEVVTGALRAGGMAAVEFAAKLPAMAIELGKLGIQAESTENRFVKFAGGADRATMFLDAFNAGTDRTVDRMTAMSSAGRLLQMGLVDTGEEMGQIAAMATKLGDQTEDTSSRISGFAAMLANQSIPRLDNYGISSGRVRTRIEELQRSIKGLSREEAFKMAVMEEGAKALETLGDTSETTAHKLDALKAAFQDAKISSGEYFAAAVSGAEGVDNLAGAIRAAPRFVYRFSESLRILQAVQTRGVLGIGEMRRELRALWQDTEDAGDATEIMRYRHLRASEAAEELASSQRDASDAVEESIRYYKETPSIYELTAKGQDLAAASADRLAIAQQAAADAAGESTKSQLALAASLSDATDAQIAQAGIAQLSIALEEGEITFDQYNTAVEETQLAFGLATPESMALSQGIADLTSRLSDGTLGATSYDEALADLIMQSKAAGVETDAFANALDGLPKEINIDIVTRYRTEGTPPPQIDAPRMGGEAMQHGSAFAPGGWATVGERGPELAYIPRGAQVFPADQSRHMTTNHYNLTVNSNTPSTGVANEFYLMESMAR